MEKDLNEKGFTFSIHAAQVGSDMPSTSSRSARLISIHAAQVGSDIAVLQGRLTKDVISIHASYNNFEDFNPRCPSGQRH